jgi:hypothetical protein
MDSRLLIEYRDCHSINNHKSPFVNDSTINNPQINNVPESGRAWAMIAALGRQAS